MKRKLVNARFLKQTALAVPAAALMLGAAQAGTTVGLNVQSWYYDASTTPQTIGFGQCYQTTGFPVTAKAFGLAPANWVNTEPQYCKAAVATSVVLGSVTANLSAVNPWSGDIGNLVNPADEWTNRACCPSRFIPRASCLVVIAALAGITNPRAVWDSDRQKRANCRPKTPGSILSAQLL